MGDSWRAVLHLAFVDGMSWGRDIIFTYGPLGFVATAQYHPRTFTTLVLAWIFLATVTVGNAAAVLLSGPAGFEASKLRRHGCVFICLILLVTVSNGDVYPRESAFFVLVNIFLVRCLLLPRCRPDWLLVALTIAVAMSVLVKFSLFVAAAPIVLATSVDDLLERSVPWVGVIFTSGVVALWVAAGQPLGNLSAFFLTSFELADGYSGAMGITVSRPPQVWLEVIAYWLTVGVLIAVAAIAARGSRRRRLFGFATGVTTTFALFKASFVRQDEHILLAAHALVASALLITPLAIARLGCGRRAVLLAIVALGVPIAFATIAAEGSGRHEATVFQGPMVWVDTMETQVRGLGVLLMSPGENRRAYEDNLARVRRASALPSVEGTVDLYTATQTQVLACRYVYRPRPVFQSYVAYTERLANLNADHLRGPTAPDVVFYDLQVPDQRLPSQDDSASWLRLLEGYEAVGVEGTSYMLRRVAVPRQVTLKPLFARTVMLGDPIEIPPPDAGPIWVRAVVSPTLFGLFAEKCFRSAAFYIDVDTPLVSRRFRVVAATASQGFIISPLVLATPDLAAVFAPDHRDPVQPQPVRRLRFGADEPLLPEFEATIQVFVYRVELNSARKD
jgi:hypothetical protein